MPVYEFCCAACGPFEQRRSLQEAGEPMACPTCQDVATRIYSTAGFILTSGTVRRRIEQSAEPKVITRPTPVEPPSNPLKQSVGGRPWQLGHTAQTGTVHPRLQRIYRLSEKVS